MLRVWTRGACTLPAQEWRSSLQRADLVDGGGRLIHSTETRAADGQSIFELNQISDARGLVRSRRIQLDGVGETLAIGVDLHGRISRIIFDPLVNLDTTQVGMASRQVELDRLWRGANAAMPGGAEEVRIDVAPDGARRGLTRRIGGTVVERRRYSIDATGRAVEIGSGRTDDVDGLPVKLRGDTLHYDALRRLKSITRSGAIVLEISYDALGRIAGIRADNNSWDLLHAEGNLVEIRDAGVPVTQFVRLPGGQLVEAGLPAAPLRSLVDAQGSLIGLADVAGRLVASCFRDPFGEQRQIAGAWPAIGPSFQGLLGIRGIELIFTPARSLEPRSGAFLEPDPLGFADGFNRTIYAAGNPLVLCDPSGLMAQPVGFGGRPKGLTYTFGLGTHTLDDAWYNRALLAIAGALTSIAVGLFDTVKMGVDIAGLTVDYMSGWQLDYRAKSGIGQAAQRGQIGGGLDGLRFIGQGIIDTPGRLWELIERRDYGAFGAEFLNLYSLGRSAYGFTRGIVGLRDNLSIRALARLRPHEPAWEEGLRGQQINKMQPMASRLAGVSRSSGTPDLGYERVIPVAEGDLSVAYYHYPTDAIRISEAAFKPFSRVRPISGRSRVLQVAMGGRKHLARQSCVACLGSRESPSLPVSYVSTGVQALARHAVPSGPSRIREHVHARASIAVMGAWRVGLRNEGSGWPLCKRNRQSWNVAHWFSRFSCR